MKLFIIYKIAKFHSREFLVYPLETAALLLRRILLVGLLVYFWYLVEQGNSVQGLQILPYILIASGTLFLSLGHNFRQAGEIYVDIKLGRLNNLLIRPFNELNYELGVYLGRNVLEFFFSILNIIAGLVLLDGLTGSRIALFILSLISAVYIGYALNIMVASVSFWVVESGYFRLTAYFLIRVISGLYIPLTFFGDFWGNLLQFLPFSQIAFVPSYVLTGDDFQGAAMLVGAGLVWSVVMLRSAYFIWDTGLRKYGAVGI